MEWIRDIWWFYPVWRLTGHRNWPEVFQGVASYLRALKRKVKKTHSLDMKCRDCNHYLWREYAHPWGGYCKFLKKTASNEWRCPVFESKEVS